MPSRLARKRHTREPKRLFHILCEGANTEPKYFATLREVISGSLISIKPYPHVGVPLTIAREAKKLSKELGLLKRTKKPKNSFEEKDEVWAVFDRDAHPNYNQAIDECMALNIGVARSNPCFELWLTLHYENFDRPDDRHQMQKHFEALDPIYKKGSGKNADFSSLIQNLNEAEQRARNMLDRREQEGDSNGPPSTTVHELTMKIQDAAQNHKT